MQYENCSFAVDVLECPRCGSRMRILAAIEDPSVAGKILDCLGLPSRPLLLLPPGATDKTHSPNFDGRPTAFADVCFQAGCFRVWFEGRRVQIFVRPEIPLRNSFPDAPKSSFCAAPLPHLRPRP